MITAYCTFKSKDSRMFVIWGDGKSKSSKIEHFNNVQLEYND